MVHVPSSQDFPGLRYKMLKHPHSIENGRLHNTVICDVTLALPYSNYRLCFPLFLRKLHLVPKCDCCLTHLGRLDYCIYSKPYPYNMLYKKKHLIFKII